LGVPYEEPLNPDIVVETNKLKPTECVEKIYSVLNRKFKV